MPVISLSPSCLPKPPAVARVLDERDQVVREERRVVEARPRPVAAVEDRQTRTRGARPALAELEDRAPVALASAFALNGVCPSTAVSWIVTQFVSKDEP